MRRKRSMKKSKIAQACILVLCLLFLMPALLFAAEDAKAIGARKAALNDFFGKQVCKDCHGPTPIYNIRSARYQYDLSGHNTYGHSFYANGGDCIGCHTHEGFLQKQATGKIGEKDYVKAPTQMGCFTCHDPHMTGDLSLRTVAPVTLIHGETFDIGKGNLCANCHTSRYKNDIVKDTPAKKLPGFWGAHHGMQADVLIGSNGYEYPGKKYFNSVHSTLTKNSCLECHMKLPDKRFSFEPGIGGHSFSLAGEVHHQPKLNVTGCLGKCHTKVKQVKAMNEDTPVDKFWWHQTPAVFDVEAKADFDNDGKKEPLQSEVEGLLNLFVNNKGTGYLQKGKLPYYKKDGSWNWTKSDQVRPKKEVAALYNYKYILEDRSRGIHNAPYTIQLLYDSIETLDSGFDASKRNTYKPPEEYKAP